MRRCDRSIRGQSLVEFALVLPMFLLLLIGVTEFGRAWMTRNILTGASREAVRIAAVQGNTASALSRANNILSSAGISGASVNIADDGAPTAPAASPYRTLFPSASPGSSDVGILSGDEIHAHHFHVHAKRILKGDSAMNRKRILGIVGFAICLALVASLGAYRFLSEKNQMAESAKLQTVGVAVAVVDIPLGTTINSNQIGVSLWPRNLYPKDAFTTAVPVVGRVAMRDFLRGEPVVESKLVPKDKSSGLLSLKVPAGMRAFTVKVNEVVGVGGFIVPDSRVDVVVTTAVSPQRQQEQVAKTFLQNILVLAAGQVVEQKDNKPVTVNTVTLAVTPDESEKLALASNDGKIQLVMRNFADAQKVETPGSDKGGLLSSMRPKPAVSAKKTVASKAVYRKASARGARPGRQGGVRRRGHQGREAVGRNVPITRTQEFLQGGGSIP